MAKRKAAVEIDATELLNNFKGARHKREQIEIEADLHCCSPRMIAEVLDRIGALEGTGITPRQFSDRYEPVPAAQPGRRQYRWDTSKALELYRAGVSINRIGELIGVSHTSIENWVKNEKLTRPPVRPGRKPKQKSDFKLDEAEPVKKERPVEDELLDREEEQERHERILASVDEGRRETPQSVCKHTDLDHYIVPVPVRDEPSVMTIKQFRVAMCRLFSDALDDAALSINGETVRDIFGVEICVRNDRVLVDLRTKEAAS